MEVSKETFMEFQQANGFNRASSLILITRPIAASDELANLAAFVPMFMGFLRAWIHMLEVGAMTLNHFHDLFVGLCHGVSRGEYRALHY